MCVAAALWVSPNIKTLKKKMGKLAEKSLWPERS